MVVGFGFVQFVIFDLIFFVMGALDIVCLMVCIFSQFDFLCHVANSDNDQRDRSPTLIRGGKPGEKRKMLQ